jgi:hypothetical protein
MNIDWPGVVLGSMAVASSVNFICLGQTYISSLKISNQKAKMDLYHHILHQHHECTRVYGNDSIKCESINAALKNFKLN